MNLKNLLNRLGPGLLYAGAAIGVSHLVQSTRAGAQFGYFMAIFIILANVIKYPFFEAGPRYVAATGDSLLAGYKKLGNWALWVFILMTLSTMFIIQAAVTVVTAGLAQTITGFNFGAVNWSMLLLFGCGFILLFNKYSLLDKLVKIIILTLTATTIVSVVAGLFTSYPKTGEMVTFSFNNHAHLIFLAALMGWMPAPVDISIWHSIWCEAKNKETGRRSTLKEESFDFNVGFIGTAFLAIGFLTLGTMVMYGSGTTFSNGAAGFAGQLIQLYTKNLGSWSYPVIAIAAFTTMFSTTITLLDAFPRALRESVEQIFPNIPEQSQKVYIKLLVVTMIGTSVLLYGFLKNMKAMVDLATTISFVLAPVFAILNHLVIHGKDIPTEFRPPRWLKLYSYFGIIFLIVFTVAYFIIKSKA